MVLASEIVVPSAAEGSPLAGLLDRFEPLWTASDRILRKCHTTMKLPMASNALLTEESMLRMEAHIPELAADAVKRAYFQALTNQALTTSGKVLEVRNAQLVETTVEGQFRIIRNLAKPLAKHRSLLNLETVFRPG